MTIPILIIYDNWGETKGTDGKNKKKVQILCKWGRSRRLRRAFLEATAGVGIRVRRTVAAYAERPALQDLFIVTTVAQARVTTAEAPIIRDVGTVASGCGGRAKSP